MVGLVGQVHPAQQEAKAACRINRLAGGAGDERTRQRVGLARSGICKGPLRGPGVAGQSDSKRTGRECVLCVKKAVRLFGACVMAEVSSGCLAGALFASLAGVGLLVAAGGELASCANTEEQQKRITTETAAAMVFMGPGYVRSVARPSCVTPARSEIRNSAYKIGNRDLVGRR